MEHLLVRWKKTQARDGALRDRGALGLQRGLRTGTSLVRARQRALALRRMRLVAISHHFSL
jgi:hypothetical protein